MPLGPDLEPWVYAYVVLFAAVHVGLLYVVVRRRAMDGGPSSTAGESPPDPPENLPPVDAERTVRCPNCGVENEAGYRFCRFCVGEIGGGAVAVGREESPRSRRMF